jgi:hypothetical protein
MLFSGDCNYSNEYQTPRPRKERGSSSPSHETKQRASSSEPSSDEKDKVIELFLI